MAHEYSVQIHDWITKKMDQVRGRCKAAESDNDPATHQYFSGQLEELQFIRQYLTDQIDLDTQKYYQ